MEDKWYVYTTENGDTWDQVSYKLFKDSSLFHFLCEWNEEYIDYFIFPAGLKLKYKLVKKNDSNIAPWRK